MDGMLIVILGAGLTGVLLVGVSLYQRSRARKTVPAGSKYARTGYEQPGSCPKITEIFGVAEDGSIVHRSPRKRELEFGGPGAPKKIPKLSNFEKKPSLEKDKIKYLFQSKSDLRNDN